MKTPLRASFLSLFALISFLLAGPVFGDTADISYEDSVSDTTPDWSSNWDDAWGNNDWAAWNFTEYCETDSRVYLGPVYVHRTLEYTTENSTLNNMLGFTGGEKSQGNFLGVNGGYEYKPLCSWYGRLDITWSNGVLKGCPRNHDNDWFFDGRIGYTWGECSPCGWSLTPYVGVGYFLIDRKFKFVDANLKYNSWYIPVGIQGEVELMPDFTGGLDLTWMPQVSSRVTIDSDTFSNMRDGGIDSSYGWRVEVPFRYTLPCSYEVEITIAPFWQQFRFGQINQTSRVVEPAITIAEESIEPIVITTPGLPKARENFWGAKFLIGMRF